MAKLAESAMCAEYSAESTLESAESNLGVAESNLRLAESILGVAESTERTLMSSSCDGEGFMNVSSSTMCGARRENLKILEDATPKIYSGQQQGGIPMSEALSPPSGLSKNPHTIHPIPEYAQHDREGWAARRDLGRGLTTAESEEIRRLNREHIKPQLVQ